MPRAPDPNKEKAKELYLSGVKLIEVASQLNLPEGTIRGWKSRYNWDCNATNKKCNATKHKGGQPGNHNASGPPKNKNAVKHGLFQKYLPQETLDIVNRMSKSPIDLLWDNIQIAYAAILRAQHINYVRDIGDVTTTKIGEGYSDSGSSEKWEVQQAWDKQANFLKAQARAQSELRSMIKQYDELLKSDLATEEQKLRIEKLKAETAKLNGTDNQDALTKLDDVLQNIKGVV